MSKEVYTLVIRSDTVNTQSVNSGSRLDGKYRILWSQVLPSKYNKFLVNTYFKATPEGDDLSAFNSILTVNVHTNLMNVYSYDTYNQGTSRLLCCAEKICNSNDNTNFDVGYISRYGESPPIVINYPNESFLEVKLYDSDGSTAVTSSALPMDYILILTFQGIE